MSFTDSDSDAEVFQDGWASALPSPKSQESMSRSSSPPIRVSYRSHKRQRQPASPLERFDLTVMGFLFSVFEQREGPLAEKFLVSQVAERLEELRKSDGSKYAKSAEKVVRGCLSNAELFAKQGQHWILRANNALLYREHILKTLEKRVNRHIEPKVFSSPQEPQKRKPSAASYQSVLLLERLSRHMQGSSEYAHHFKQPFGSLKGSEEITGVAQSLGNEKFLGILQGFEMLNDHFSGLNYRAGHITEKLGNSSDLRLALGMAEAIRAQLSTQNLAKSSPS